MAHAILRINLTSRLEGPDLNNLGRPNPPNEVFIDKENFVNKQAAVAIQHATEPGIISVPSSVPQTIHMGQNPPTGNQFVGGDLPVTQAYKRFEEGITNAFVPTTHNYITWSVIDKHTDTKFRRMPTLGDLTVTIPRYVVDSSGADALTRVSESAAAHGIYYTSVPSNSPTELITGMDDEFAKPFAPFMVLEYHVDHNMIDVKYLKEFNTWMKSQISWIIGGFINRVKTHEAEQDKKPEDQFVAHASGWLYQYFSHTRLYFNSQFPTRLTSLFECPIYRDTALCADYIKLADVMNFDKQLIRRGITFNRPVNI
jgi:hypothetical protein